MKRYRWIILAVLLFASWLLAEYLMHRRVVPPKNVTSLQTFLAWRPSTEHFAVTRTDGDEHLIAYGPNGALLPSGPSAYVFDSSGHLVDWSADVGDSPRFDEHWQSQRSRGGPRLSRQEAANWPTTRPAKWRSIFSPPPLAKRGEAVPGTTAFRCAVVSSWSGPPLAHGTVGFTSRGSNRTGCLGPIRICLKSRCAGFSR